MYIYFLVSLNIVLLVTGQILWKIGLNNSGGFRLDNLLAIIMSPYIIIGIVLYVVATGVWFVVLSKSDLSAVYPLQSLAYALGAIAGFIIFNEYISLTRWIGVIIIIFGVYLVTIK